MIHIDQIAASSTTASDAFIKRASGRYYTGEPVGLQLAASMVRVLVEGSAATSTEVTVVDPFGGDGRLVAWLIEAWGRRGLPEVRWRVELWDLVDLGFREARARFDRLIGAGHLLEYDLVVADAFSRASSEPRQFDIVITNPPWELLKPDRRELARLDDILREAYVESMRQYDRWLSAAFPKSQPRRKFAGWGTNLSRVGLDLSLALARPGGLVGAVMPASLLADDQSTALRRHLLTEHALREVAYYPAEAKHYGTADVASITLVVGAGEPAATSVLLHTAGAAEEGCVAEPAEIHLVPAKLEATDFVLPVAFGASAIQLLSKLSELHPRWSALEADPDAGFWAGREVDETGSAKWLVDLDDDSTPFLKGRMIDRYKVREAPSKAVGKPGWKPTASIRHERIAWRDVSRPNQKRRVVATLVPPGWALGNSLGVACFQKGSAGALRALLGVMSSTVFEFQLRAHLATGHVSLSSLRKVALPTFGLLESDLELQTLVEAVLAGESGAEELADAHVASNIFRLSLEDYQTILDLYPKMSDEEKSARYRAFADVEMKSLPERTTTATDSTGECEEVPGPEPAESEDVPDPEPSASLEPVRTPIFNHFSARLSELDLRMVRAVPEGGNWKDIPVEIPSRRLEQIRESYARGEGSRSTYYGRLRRGMPSYTINTYFNRPGNGCHIHPEQDRVLSHREAARLQSFPDDFAFVGPQGAVRTQIGNAVPPLLAYQIARTLGRPGAYVDLFAGAGGMGLGFKWAGWRPVIANDLKPRFVATYMQNVHSRAITGSITDPEVVEALVEAARAARQPGEPFWVLGGPPCQGFSTAGKRRSMEDQRNHLVWDYVRFLERVMPDGFVFENVTGLMNMKGGSVFSEVKEAFSAVMPSVHGSVVAADEYGIPQRRKRVFLVGQRTQDNGAWVPPPTVTRTPTGQPSLFAHEQASVTVEEALWDLPPLAPNEDGSSKRYVSRPRTTYQALMRGLVTPEEYLSRLAKGNRTWTDEAPPVVSGR